MPSKKNKVSTDLALVQEGIEEFCEDIVEIDLIGLN